MVLQTTPLERLYKLDKAYAGELDKLLHDERYIGQLMGLQGDELIQIVDYLSDTIRRLIRVGESPRKCLHILRKISSTRTVLPSTYQVSGTLSVSPDSPVAHGGFCDVQRGSLSTVEDVCVKKLRLYSSGNQEKINELFRREAIVWKHINHPNIVPFKGVILEPPQLISKWMPGGELRQYIKKNSSTDLIHLLLGVAYGLAYLHSHEIIHGDLKGPNILIDASGNVQITDFGLSSIVRDPGSIMSVPVENGYTPRWTAPEIFRGTAIPNKETDVFSFAMVAIEVFSGEVPFPKSKSTAVPATIMLGGRPDRPTHPGLTDPLWRLIERCWSEAPADRPEIGDVIKVLKGIEYVPPPKGLPEEPHAQTQEPSQMVGYDTETPSLGPTLSPQKVKGQGSSIPKDANTAGGETTTKPASKLPPNNGPPANGPKVTVEKGREERAPPKGVKGDKDGKGVERQKSRKGPERERKPDGIEEAAREVGVTSGEGLPNDSRSTSVMDHSSHKAPEPSSDSDDNTIVPPIPGSSTRGSIEKPPPSPNLESEPAIRPSVTVNGNKPGGQNSKLPPVRPGLGQAGNPQGSDRSPPQMQGRRQTDVRHAALPSQLPVAITPTKYETLGVLPKKPWWKCC